MLNKTMCEAGAKARTRTLAARPSSNCCGRALTTAAGQRPAVATKSSPVDLARLSEMMSTQEVDPERRFALERLSTVLDVPMGAVKNMVFKRKALLTLTPEDVTSRIKQLADIIEVSQELARQMVVIQPALLFDTEKQAETLKFGIQSICFELDAQKDEVVQLILKNQSVLHGRELRLSVADMAHLAMLREPKGRIVDSGNPYA